ncbi:MFS transporter [Streptomyces sp. DSM 42041]|uniref:MFS transporter n=1 Tax=Streptomyces hazeniae TaxID=3075538 RepID=A0ABU2NVS2_9ACTN|nr:MFS transporter [Streptomyces sp. DSM 42041]MDT0381087.1 MFS transporter [Streptomyces sp. DSM 42041]
MKEPTTALTPGKGPASYGRTGGLRKAILGSFVGTTIEWYDFFLYGSAAALIFNKVFFPDFDPLTGTLLAFATYSVAFLARPLGGVLFGHMGDRYGRKSTLMATLMLMGLSTFLMGVLPGYDTLGVAAPVLLVVLRFCQGLGLGGEWGGAVAIVAEHGEASGGARRRGFYASWPQIGVPMGNLLAVGALALVGTVLSEEQFDSWGWRVPFLLSAVLILVGLWIRKAVEESPLFRESMQQAPERHPLRDVFRDHRRPLLITIGMRIASDVSYYTFALFSITYVTQQLGADRSLVLNGVIIASAVQLLAIPAFAVLSDRVGRRPVYLAGAVIVGVWGFAFFPLLDTESAGAAALAITVGLIGQAAMYGPMAAYIAELFPTPVRYSGSSVGYQLAGVVGGSVAPLIGVALLSRFDSGYAVAAYTALASAVTVAAVWWSKETSKTAL